MPREIKTTLAVDGEQAFKRAINDASTSIRNMGSQLTLATAQFKKDGDAMKLMETRSKALKGQIGQQEEIVKALEKALQESTKAYGANSEKTEKWEAELNRAKARLVNLQSELTLNEQGLDRNGKAFEDSSQKAADYQATLQTVGKGIAFENINSGLERIKGGFQGALEKVLGFAKALRETMVDAGHWADDLITDATKYGMDVETLQRWQNAADLIDTPVETIINAQDKLSKKMRSGWKDGKTDMWQILGIDIKDENGYRDQMDVLFELGETLKNMEWEDGNDIRADAYAMEVFGKSYKDLKPLFAAGRAEWEKTVAEQRVVSQAHVEALGQMDDANNKLENSWETLKMSALAELAPAITEITEGLTELLNEFNDWMETEEGKQAMQDLADGLKELFSGLKDVEFSDAIDIVKGALNKIQEALNWLNDNKDNVVSALTIIGGGFAALSVAGVATNLLSIVSSFQTLWKGAGKPLPSIPGSTPTTGTTPAATGTGTGAAAAGGSAAVGTPLRAKIGGMLASNGLSLLVPAGVLALGVAPGVAAQKETEAEKIGEYETTETLAAAAQEAAEAAKETNEDLKPYADWLLKQTAWLRELNTASGPKVDENGNYKRGLFGFLDLNPTAQAEMILQSLGDVKTRGGLYSDIRRYGARNGMGETAVAGTGYQAWDLLLRYWGLYTEKDSAGRDTGRRVDAPLEQYEIDALVEYLRDMQSTKLEDALNEMKVNTQSAEQSAEKVAQMDIKKFNGIPDGVEKSAQRGVQRGISGIKIEVDGKSFAKALVPYIDEELGSR